MDVMLPLTKNTPLMWTELFGRRDGPIRGGLLYPLVLKIKFTFIAYFVIYKLSLYFISVPSTSSDKVKVAPEQTLGSPSTLDLEQLYKVLQTEDDSVTCLLVQDDSPRKSLSITPVSKPQEIVKLVQPSTSLNATANFLKNKILDQQVVNPSPVVGGQPAPFRRGKAFSVAAATAGLKDSPGTAGLKDSAIETLFDWYLGDGVPACLKMVNELKKMIGSKGDRFNVDTKCAEDNAVCVGCKEGPMSADERRQHQPYCERYLSWLKGGQEITFNKYLCFMCGDDSIEFTSRQHLGRHVKECHLSRVPGKEAHQIMRFHCFSCKRDFTSPAATERQIFKTLGTVLHHLIRVHDFSPPEYVRMVHCPLGECNFLTPDARFFYAHQNNHKKQVCDTCGRVTSQNTTHVCSKKGEDGGVRFMCDTCSKSFSTQNSLRSHIRLVHNKTDKSKVLCHYCPKVCSTTHQFNLHLYCQHGINQSKNTYQCPHCELVHVSRYRVKKHIWKVHYKQGKVSEPVPARKPRGKAKLEVFESQE